VLAIYLAGSIARGAATGSSDLDLCAIVEEPASSSRQPPIVISGRPVFYRLHPLRLYSDIEGLLTGSVVLSSQIVDAKALYDPKGVFAKIQRAVLRRYDDPFYLKARISLSLEAARRHLLLARLRVRQGRAYEVPSHLAQLVVYGLAPAIFFLADEPPTERRCLAALKPACEMLGADSIYDELVNLLGLDEASNGWAEQAINGVGELAETAGQALRNHNQRLYDLNADWLSTAMARYFIEGAKELLADGKREASIYCSMVIASRILDIIREAGDSLPPEVLVNAEQLGSRVFRNEAVDQRTITTRLRQAEVVVEETRRLATVQLQRTTPMKRERRA